MSSLSSRTSHWDHLFSIALDLIHQIELKDAPLDDWTLGGGTAMMLQIGHRESHDIDIFFSNPGVLGYLNPEITDLTFEIMPSGYDSDGLSYRKFSFRDIGEIDFIVAPNMTANSSNCIVVAGAHTNVETIPEIITKKIYYRGASIKPRDIFDIAAARADHGNDVVDALSGYPDSVTRALDTLDELNPAFVRNAISDLMITKPFQDIAPDAFVIAQELLGQSLNVARENAKREDVVHD